MNKYTFVIWTVLALTLLPAASTAQLHAHNSTYIFVTAQDIGETDAEAVVIEEGTTHWSSEPGSEERVPSVARPEVVVPDELVDYYANGKPIALESGVPSSVNWHEVNQTLLSGGKCIEAVDRGVKVDDDRPIHQFELISMVSPDKCSVKK